MKIKVLIISLLVVILCVIGYFIIDLNVKNVSLKKKYSEMYEIVKQNEIDKEIYFEKEKELNELKEKNKDKIKKYEEVLGWNQEIKGYLD